MLINHDALIVCGYKRVSSEILSLDYSSLINSESCAEIERVVFLCCLRCNAQQIQANKVYLSLINLHKIK